MTHHTASAKKSGPRFGYIREIISELRKVVWLTRREVAYLTGLVLIVTAIFAALLGSLDYAFTQLVDKVFMGG